MTLFANVCCIVCLDEWDQISETEYQGRKVEAMVLIADGQSWCKTHYRQWRDRNKTTVTVEQQAGLTPGS